MGLSAKDKKAVEKAAKAGGLTGVKVSSSGNVSASNSATKTGVNPQTGASVNSSPPPLNTPPAPPPTQDTAPMGTTAKDPAANVSKPNTTIPSSQANSGAASGVSIWGPSTINTSGGTPFSSNTSSNSSNASTANALMSSLIPKSSSAGTGNSYTGGSITDYLSSVGKASDYNSRAALAQQYGISGYSGTAEQNTQLLNKLRGSGNTTTSYSTPAPAAGVTNASTEYTQAPTTASVISPYVAPATAAPTQTETVAAPAMGLYGQLIEQQAARSQVSKEYQKALDNYQKAVDNYNKLEQTINDQMADIELDPGSLYFQTGRKGVLQQLGAKKLADANANVVKAQQALQFATSQYSAQTQALQGAIGAAGTVLQGGQYMPFGGDNSSFQAGLDRQRAVDTYNYNTQTGLNFSGQASQLDQPMHALSLLGPQLSNYLSSNGLNTNTSVMANSLVNSGLSQTNPAAYAVIKNAGTEAQVLISQIAGFNSSLIPSDITQKANAMSIDNMSPQDIVLFINAANAIAQPRYASLKSSAQSALGSSFVPYSGSTQSNPYAAIPNTPTPQNLIGNSGGNVTSPLGNAAIGGALQFGNYIVPAISSVVGWFTGGGLLKGAAGMLGGLIKK